MSRAAFLRRSSGFLAVMFIGRGRALPPLRTALTHPEPRPGITGEHVLTAEAVGSAYKGKVAKGYDAARENPALFDGIACACSCGGKNGTHRSLLVCLETKQPTGCQSCMEEGELVGRLAHEGKSLAEIREAIDKKFD